MLQFDGMSAFLLVGTLLLCSVSGLLPFLVAASRGRTAFGGIGTAFVATAAVTFGWPAALAASFLATCAILAVSPTGQPSESAALEQFHLAPDLDQDAFDSLDAALALACA